MPSLRVWSDPDEARMWVLCLPPGGGGAHLYRGWARRLPSALGVAGVELPGHGSRGCEPLETDAEALVAKLARDVAPLFNRPVVLFGHSMGALLALDLARELRADHDRRIAALVAAASEPPGHPGAPVAGDVGTDRLLADQVRAWGGTAPDLMADQEYLGELLRVLRADLDLMAARPNRPAPPLDCPVHVYLGAADETAPSEPTVAGWAAQSAVGHAVRVFPGGHFFVRDAEEEVLAGLLADADAVVGGRLVAPRSGA